MPVAGTCRVVCFSPKHNLTMAQMEKSDIIKIINTWTSEYVALASEGAEYIQIFENKGAIMGCSNPHPHGQIWATKHVPQEPAKELVQMRAYFEDKHSCLLCDYVKEELERKERVVYENTSFIVLVPYWALWPFEVLLLPKVHVSSLADLSEELKADFADAMSIMAIKYDNLFSCSFPYSMGLHQAPATPAQDQHIKNGTRMDVHLHVHFYPPLLRSATVKKFLVGYEMLGEPQRDLTPEQAAVRLRELPTVHYKNQKN